MKKIGAFLLALLLTLSLCGCKIEGDFGFDAPEEWATQEAEKNDTDQPSPSQPEAVTEEYVTGIISKEFTEPRNVILMIGDGMGINDIALAEKYAEGVYDFGLILNKLQNQGLVTTKSLDNEITDSAASATALATGNKTNNGIIGKTPDGSDLKNLAEAAKEQGKKVGIVTDDHIYGATPSAFVTHNVSRNNYGELVNGILTFAPDVLIGSSYDSFVNNLTEDGKTAFAEAYAVAKGLDEFKNAYAEAIGNGKKLAGFNGGCTDVPSDHLAVSAKNALAMLESQNGFFLLIEGCGTDSYGHSNSIAGKMASVVSFDRALSEVLRFMETHPDTLLIITSDHETGGVALPEDGVLPAGSLFTTTTHTSYEVKVFALGKGSEYFSGKTVDNTEVGNYLMNLMANKTENAE